MIRLIVGKCEKFDPFLGLKFYSLACSPVLPPLLLLLNLVDVQCASIISQEKVSNFYNFPGKDQRFLQLPKRWTPFWQPRANGKPAQQSREKERRVKVPAQETHATSYSAILDFLFDDSETTNIWIQHKHKKTHSFLGWKWLNNFFDLSKECCFS